MSLKQIFIIEDHLIMREVLSDLIKHEPGLEVCGTAETGEAALQQLVAVEADLVLLDLKLPGMNGFDVMQALQVRQPDLPCLILSGYSEMYYVRRAFSVGARGYILKGKPEEILEAIQTVSGGGMYLSAALQAKLSGADR